MAKSHKPPKVGEIYMSMSDLYSNLLRQLCSRSRLDCIELYFGYDGDNFVSLFRPSIICLCWKN